MVRAQPAPSAVRAWVARSLSRDLREARWRMVPMPMRRGQFVWRAGVPGRGYLGVYAEAVFGRDERRVFLSTRPRVVGTGTAP